ncbi:hypothetical protein TI05_13520 [Achromatium sp. WMS3]|nr:hypothetical protein TI05_13520 [Achromatium sp. WMS3]
MSALSIFNFQDNIIRTITVNSKIWFVGIDVAKALGYANVAKAVTQHCRKYKPLNLLVCPNWAGNINQEVMGLDYKTNMIQEPDLYALVFGSKLPSSVGCAQRTTFHGQN